MSAVSQRRIIHLSLTCAVVWAVGLPAFAKDSDWKPLTPDIELKVGDPVRVEVNGEWTEGIVVDFFGHSKKPKVEYFDPRHRRKLTRIFSADKVQVPLGRAGRGGLPAKAKPGANPFATADNFRLWTDSTGKFKIEAELVKTTGTEAVLKKRDGSTITVPISRLCRDDQRHIASLSGGGSENRPTSGDSPPTPARIETINPNWGGARELKLDEEVKPANLEPDGGATANVAAARPVLLPVEQKNGGEIQAVLSAHDVPTLVSVVSFRHFFKERTSKIFRFDLASQRPTIQTLEIPDFSETMDVGPKGELVLTRGSGAKDGDKTAIALWKLENGQLIPLWKCIPYDGSDKTFHKSVDWATFLDEKHILTANFGGKVVLWELPTMRAIYKLETRASSFPAFSPGRRYMAVAAKNGLCVLDPKSGRILGTYAGSSQSGRPVFSPDGKRLALASSVRTQAWDFSTGEIYRDISYTLSNSHGTVPSWPVPGYILLGGRYLVDLERHTLLWDYRTKSGRGLTGTAIAGKLWTVLEENSSRALVPLDIPDTYAKQALSAIRPEDTLVLQPGVDVSLEVRLSGTPQEQQEITDSLRGQLQANGFKVADGVPIRLIVQTQPGKVEKTDYHRGGEVNFQQWISRAELLIDGVLVWERQTVSGAPMMLRVKDDETVEQALQKYQKPNLSFFKSLGLPRFLCVPRNTRTFGATELTPSGPKPAKPEPRQKPGPQIPGIPGNRA